MSLVVPLLQFVQAGVSLFAIDTRRVERDSLNAVCGPVPSVKREWPGAGWTSSESVLVN